MKALILIGPIIDYIIDFRIAPLTFHEIKKKKKPSIKDKGIFFLERIQKKNCRMKIEK